MGIVLFLTIPSVLIYQNQASTIKDDISVSQAYVALRKIIDTSESIYYLGSPSKETVKAYFPEMIRNITITKYEIEAYVDTHPVYLVSKIPINGTLLATTGIHEIEIVAKDNGTNYVQIIGR